MQLLEMVCQEYGGRVELAKAYYQALTESVEQNFHGNGVIASMEHCNDFMLLGTRNISLGRVGDDFWCTDPSGDPNGTFWLQGCHMVHCAYNSLWMAHFIHPDWDMFQSTHPCASFHAASRAISGGPIYVSDSVGCHDFPLLRSLALPDGTILRCQHYALPTRDCLFHDPLHDGTTMLKLWNLNKHTGVLGAFNCQGGGWSREARRNKSAAQFSRTLIAMARPSDIEWNQGKTPISVHETDRFAAYFHKSKKLTLLQPDQEFEVTLDPFNYELVVVSPIRCFGPSNNVEFAPIGLVNMLNSGGAVESIAIRDDNSEILAVEVDVKGAGDMRAYSSIRPVACRMNGKEVEFTYEASMVFVQVPWSGSSSKLCHVQYLY